MKKILNEYLLFFFVMACLVLELVFLALYYVLYCSAVVRI